MSNIRRQSDAGEYRQERFSKRPEFERGLMANLVAKRCALLGTPSDRELVWFLQYQSHQSGGLDRMAIELMAQFPERIASRSMQKIGIEPGQVYSASEVKIIREETGGAFPLRGDSIDITLDWSFLGIGRANAPKDMAKHFPTSYAAESFLGHCLQACEKQLEKHLQALCLDPAQPVADGSPWYFPTLVSTLREYMAAHAVANKPAATTEIGSQVDSALEYAMESGSLVLVDGMARTGKTFSAQAWCAQRPGQARYVQVPSSNDDISFYRAIAESLGISVNLLSKAQELRNRIEVTLQAGGLMLVLDEAHNLWGQSFYATSVPGRINWLMTALVNYGVPVALITTPQFFRSQKAIEKRTHWTSEQFTGRIGHYQKLPDTLSAEDLASVASALVPELPAAVELLAMYAQSSAKYLAGIDAAVNRARFIATKQGRKEIKLADVKQAIKESVIPSDSAFTSAMQANEKPARRRVVNVHGNADAEALQIPFRRTETPLQAHDLSAPRTTVRETGAQLVH